MNKQKTATFKGASTSADQPAPKREDMIRVDGKGQVLEMLRAADPAFRESILRGLEKRDLRLAQELRRLL